jgi:hypothetical protein
MLIHDIIKIRYSDDGYLINYPPHLISDSEMFNAFAGFNSGFGFFADNYPCMSEDTDYVQAYNQLFLTIFSYIQFNILFELDIPDWVYSYMLGEVISINSDKLDIHDLETQTHTSEIDDTFSLACSNACLYESKLWLGGLAENKIDTSAYADTDNMAMFEQLLNNIPLPYPSEDMNTLADVYAANNNAVCARPATMFGEPHVLKSLRLKQATM